MSGYADGRFGPNDPVTREQLAVILWRHAGTPQPKTAVQFSDHSTIPAYALDAASWAQDTGVISGDNANRF